MKTIQYSIVMKIRNFILWLAIVLPGVCEASAEHLVILTTNDLHSVIIPDVDGRGGVLRRKVLFDSVRVAEKNVIRIDAGDAVQGTVYFSEFGGEVEYKMMDLLGYDMNITGNHEFDNGIEALAKYYKNLKSTAISSNYDFSETLLEGMFEPYVIKEYAGKKIGFMGINLNPSGMIVGANYRGLAFSDIVETANAVAKMLKNEKGVDFVVMISHIGYDSYSDSRPSDVDVIGNSTDIDLVIGGHSHTRIDPARKKPEWLVANKEGRMIPVTQTGNQGKHVGLIDIDLSNFEVDYRLLPVDKRYDSRINYPEIEDYLKPFMQRVDSLMNNEIAVSAKDMPRGMGALSNWVCDAALQISSQLSGLDLDCSIMNKGGIRQPMPKGSVSEGLINAMFPFDNRLQILELTGDQLLRSLEAMVKRGGDITSGNLLVTYNADRKMLSAKLNGKKIIPTKKYKVATLDYIANGGDYMFPMKEGKTLFLDNVKVSVRYLAYIKELTRQGKVIDASDELRMKKVD